MTPEELAGAIVDALQQGVASGAISADLELPAQVRVERPRDRDHGDWSTNVALQLAKPTGLPPRQLASLLADRLAAHPGIKAVQVAGPGFLNITLDAASAGELARAIVETGTSYGNNDSLVGHVINLEFVSANPTGELHIGHTRWAALGDALRRLLVASGAEVTAEHYTNDAGAQLDLFARSILARARGTEVPEGGYPGEEISSIASTLLSEHPDLLELPEDQAIDLARERGFVLQMTANQGTLERFNVSFDVWFSERLLHESGAVEQAVDRLREQGHVYDAEGAVWLRTTDFGDDRDRVLVRSNGVSTYFASDAAYYLHKKDRGFAEKIYLLGADHHGYVGRLKAIVACAGDDPQTNIEVLIGQLISIKGARMGKRRGNALYLSDLLDWIGPDPLRYSLARYPADTPLDLDGENLRKRSNDNPVFYVQYAHARTCNVSRLADQDGVHRQDGFDPSLLTDQTEAVLLAALGDFPRVVAQAASLREPHRVARYLESLAAAYHRWYDVCRVRPLDAEEEITDLHRTRRWLNDATRQVLAKGLTLLGVSAPERM